MLLLFLAFIFCCLNSWGKQLGSVLHTNTVLQSLEQSLTLPALHALYRGHKKKRKENILSFFVLGTRSGLLPDVGVDQWKECCSAPGNVLLLLVPI